MSLFGLFGPPNVGKLKAEGNVQGLIKASRYEKDATVRQAAVQALVETGHARDAVKALRKIGDAQAVELLIVLLKGKDGESRQAAAEALGQIGDARVVDPLIAALKDEEWSVRCVAAKALGEIGDSQVVEPLITALEDKDWHMRQAAAEALDKLGWQSDRNETGVTYWLAKGQSDRCVEIGSPAVEPLITALKDEEWSVRCVAAKALGEIGDSQVVEPLITALKDKDWHMRQAAAEALGQIGDAQVVDPLITALYDSSKNVRRAAAEALEEIGAPAIAPLVAALKDVNMHQIITGVLERIGDSAVEALTLALEDVDADIRWAATSLLARLGGSQVVEPLIRALEDEDDYVRRGATEALGQIGDPRAVEPLIVALEDESQYVRLAAAKALGQIGDARAVRALAPFLRDGEQDIRETAADALVRIDDKRAIQSLIAALKDGKGYVRQSAASALGKTDDRRAVEPLKAILEDEQEDVRWAVNSALKSITGQDYGPTSKEDAVARLEAQEEAEKDKTTATCDRCSTSVKTGDGYAVYSQARTGISASLKVFFSTEGSAGNETGTLLLCESCANGLFTEEVWATARKTTIELDQTAVRGPRSFERIKQTQSRVNDFSVAMLAKRRGLDAAQARQEAREIAQLWWKDPRAAEKRLLAQVSEK